MELIDIGANLTHDSFDEDRDQVISDAMDAGVGRFVLTGSTEEASREALRLACEWPGTMYSTAGVHPHHASEYSDEIHAALRSLLQEPQVVSVGECGLDYFRNFSPAEAQRRAFSRQLDLAAETGLPLFLHQRDAHTDFVDILEPRIPELGKAVAHCFTGSDSDLDAYIEMGLYVGITGWICDERRGLHLREIIHRIPLDRLMIETDAPYLLPRTLDPKPKSRRNEPKYLVEILKVVADSLGMEEAEVARLTTENARRFFAIA